MNAKFLKNDFIFLQDAIKLIKSSFFPRKFRDDKGFYRELFLVGVGGNLNNVKKIFEKLVFELNKDRRFGLIASSPILLNKPFGYTNQPNFYNAVLLLATSKSPKETLKIMQHYEKKFKRKREFPNAPRTLDLDILYFDSLNLDDERLVLPHPGVEKRVSTIVPIGLMKERGWI